MKPNRSSIIVMAVLLKYPTARAIIPTKTFAAAIQRTMLRCALCPSSNNGFRHHQPKSRRRRFCALPLFDSSRTDDKYGVIIDRSPGLSSNVFVDEVISFLATDGIPIRQLPLLEIRNVLKQYFNRYPQQSHGLKLSDRVDKMMALLDSSVILEIGQETEQSSNDIVENSLIESTFANKGNGTRTDEVATSHTHSFILHICPTLTLNTIHKLYQNHDEHNSSLADAVVAYAWLNSLLTDAFYSFKSGHGDIKRSSVVHLHQDVWNRSPAIVQSRLRSKSGFYQRRIYARQTVVRRMSKSDYIPFLEDNHLWGATGAKYGYGLYMKSKCKNVNHQTDIPRVNKEDEVLVAVATFSSKREISRALNKFHSFELLRFCTKMNTAVIGGLTKLVAAFVKEVKCKHVDDNLTGIDIVTSVDRDFGSSTWPNFERVQLMDPIPMFVGNVDGLRRHAVGAGLAPLEQAAGDDASLSASMILRAGLPTSVLQQLDDHHHHTNEHDWHWRIVAQHGFHPVFDAGVERLMFVAEAGKQNDMSISDLWMASLPCYVKDHYSINSGVQRMLNSIRSKR